MIRTLLAAAVLVLATAAVRWVRDTDRLLPSETQTLDEKS